MISEKEAALEDLTIKLKKETECKLEELQKINDQRLKEKDKEIAKEKEYNEKLQQEIINKETGHEHTKDKLKMVASSFQSFIDCQPGFTKGQSEYMLRGILPESTSELSNDVAES